MLFSVEYVLRLVSARDPRRYATSFFGVVDLLAVLPGYVGLVAPETQALIVIRAIRLLPCLPRPRTRALPRRGGGAADGALREPAQAQRVLRRRAHARADHRHMYLIEGGASGFTSIPAAMYWAVVTARGPATGATVTRDPG